MPFDLVLPHSFDGVAGDQGCHCKGSPPHDADRGDGEAYLPEGSDGEDASIEVKDAQFGRCNGEGI